MHNLLLSIAATRGAAAATAFGETRVPAAARGRLSRRGRPRGREVRHERRYVTAPLTTPGERYRPADAETEAGSRGDGGAAWGRGARRPGLFREEARGGARTRRRGAEGGPAAVRRARRPEGGGGARPSRPHVSGGGQGTGRRFFGRKEEAGDGRKKDVRVPD